MQKIDDDRLYAGAFSGSDPDVRLSNAISKASSGDTIHLENGLYDSDLTVTKPLSFIGSAPEFSGTEITGITTWDFNSPVNVRNLAITSNDVTLNFLGDSSRLCDINSFLNANINVSGQRFRGYGIRQSIITFQSASKLCIIDSSTQVSVIDNGSSNLIGDIA
jgi:hypothetical protein